MAVNEVFVAVVEIIMNLVPVDEGHSSVTTNYICHLIKSEYAALVKVHLSETPTIIIFKNKSYILLYFLKNIG